MNVPPETGGEVVLIAVGANLASPFGPAALGVGLAMARVEGALGPITGKSRLYRTPCFPAGAGPDYVNAALGLRTVVPVRKVLETLHQIEAEFSRERLERWGARTMDLDLLACGLQILPDPATHATWRQLSPAAQRGAVPDTLVLPHPRLQDRAFVLVPLLEVAPGWRHPVLHMTVRQMHDALPEADRLAVRPA